MSALRGKDYRVRATHPRRPGQRFTVTDAAGKVIAKSGELCTHVDPELLASMLANGYIEPAHRPVNLAKEPDDAQ